MPRNGSGTFTLVAGNPVVTGTTISSTVHNNTLNDIRDQITNSVAADGQTTMTNDLKLGTNKITGVSNATTRTDGLNLGQFQDGTALHAAASGTNTILLTLSPAITAYANGMKISFEGSGANTGAVTVNVNSVGAKDLLHVDGSALVADDISTGRYEIIYDSSSDDFFLLSPADSYLRSTSGQLSQISEPQNLSLAASVSGNHLTIEVKGNDGNDPSASNPVYIPFRDETLTNGNYDLIAITSALSILIEDGETLGHTEGATEPIYVYALNNAGTVELAVITNPAGIDPKSLQSTTALSAAADSQTILYSTTARTSDPVTRLGFLEVELDDAVSGSGNWDTAPTLINLGQNLSNQASIAPRVLLHDSDLVSAISNQATVDIDDVFTSAYDLYEIELDNLSPTTANQVLFLRLGSGSTYESGAAAYAWTASRNVSNVQDQSDAEIQITGDQGVGLSANNGFVEGTIKLRNPTNTGIRTRMIWAIGTVDNGGTLREVTGNGQRLASESNSSLRFLFGSGNVSAGRVRVYGLSNGS